MTKRLLHISANQYPALHKDHHTKKIWQELAQAFDEYHVMARAKDNKFHHYQEGNIYLHLIPRVLNSSAVFLLSSFFIFPLIKKHRITHLLTQSSLFGGFPALLASRFFKIPLMTEIHGDEYFRFFKSRNLFKRLLGILSKKVLRNSTKVRSLNEEMSRKLNTNNITRNVVVIPNRVDFSLFNRRKTGYSVSRPVKLISVGRFVKEKAYLEALKVFSKFNECYKVTLVGGGELKQQYIDFIKKAHLENKIQLIDWVDQNALVDLIINNDIYLQTSASEAMPRSILEAMALAMPIISTDVGSIKGVLKHMENGILISSLENDQLISALKYLMEDEGERTRIANNGYKDVLKNYEWNQVFDLYRNQLINMSYEGS